MTRVYAPVSRYPFAALWPVLRWFVLGVVWHDAEGLVGRAALLGMTCVLLVTAGLARRRASG